MSVEEGLKSVDAEVIKNSRGVAKGKVTKYARALTEALILEGDKFAFQEIDDERVELARAGLETSYDEFQDLHERYKQFKPASVPTTEALVSEFEVNYFAEASTKVSTVLRTHSRYKKAKKLNLLENDIASLSETLQGKKSAAAKIVASESADEKNKAARAVRNELSSCLKEYKAKVKEFSNMKIESQESEEKFSKILNHRSSITTEVEELCMELEVIAVSSGTVPVTSRSDTSVVKLQKLNCPKFSGTPREFGQFKRDFEQIVSVPGRSDVEIGSNLRDAIPEKHRHLISHLDRSNHAEMMNVLERKFGTKMLVVQDIISQVEKMKPVTTDKMFIEFVD